MESTHSGRYRVTYVFFVRKYSEGSLSVRGMHHRNTGHKLALQDKISAEDEGQEASISSFSNHLFIQQILTVSLLDARQL